MERFDYQHLDGLSIEPNKNAIRINYSESDQGGTCLLIRFLIYLDGQVERESGYAHDSQLKTEKIERDALPGRVIMDALNWVQEQKKIGASNSKLVAAMNRIEAALKVYL